MFAVAARLGSFTRAADELSVTHGAVSKQIATLEESVGAQLFRRTGGSVVLTDEGRALRDAVVPAMRQLGLAFERFGRARTANHVVRVATVASFAAHVLIPALPRLKDLLPDIELDITTSDRPLDLTREAVDVAIRYSEAGPPGLVQSPLVPGLLVPVVHPDRRADLAALHRIQVFSNDEWANVVTDEDANDAWRRATALRLEHFVVAIEAVLAGIGFAFLPDILVRRFLATGRMSRLPIDNLPWPATFNLIHDATARSAPQVARFAEALATVLADEQ